MRSFMWYASATAPVSIVNGTVSAPEKQQMLHTSKVQCGLVVGLVCAETSH